MMLLVEHLPFTYSYMPLYTAHLAGKTGWAGGKAGTGGAPAGRGVAPRPAPARLAARTRWQRGLARATPPARRGGSLVGRRRSRGGGWLRGVIPGPNQVICADT